MIPSWDVDWSLCSGECMIRFYWLGLQASGTRWQVYSTLNHLCILWLRLADWLESDSPILLQMSTLNLTESCVPVSSTAVATATPKPTTKAPSKTKTPTSTPISPESEVGGEGDIPTSKGKNGTMAIDTGCKAKAKAKAKRF